LGSVVIELVELRTPKEHDGKTARKANAYGDAQFPGPVPGWAEVGRLPVERAHAPAIFAGIAAIVGGCGNDISHSIVIMSGLLRFEVLERKRCEGWKARQPAEEALCGRLPILVL
jgi:hypothetical protein